MNTFDDDNDPGFFEEPRRRPPRDRARRPQRSGPRRPGPPGGPNHVLRLAGLVTLGILVVFGLVLWVSSCSGQSKEAYHAYLDAMKPLARDSADVGKEFATALTARGLTMDSFKSQLASWSGREKAYYLEAQRLRPPGPLQATHDEALATFQLRYLSLDRLAGTLTTLAQSKHVGRFVAGAALASDAELLSASDIVWNELYRLRAIQTLKDQNVTGVTVPPSRIVKNSDIVSASALGIAYQRAGTSTSDGEVTGKHGSALIGVNAVENGTSTPLSASTPTTVGSGAEIDVVFKDSGDYPEVRIPVTLTVTVGGESVYTATVTVSKIAAGALATVSFTGLRLPSSAFGPSAEIYVKIKGVPGEKILGNNQATYPVLFQLSPN